MNRNIEIIHDKEELYDRCENMEQLFNYYLTLVMEYQELKKQLEQERNIRKEAIEILDKTDYEYSSRTELFNIVLETKEILNKEVK